MTDTARTCPQCGSDLPPDAPAGLCPKCLLAAGMAASSGLDSAASTSAPTTPLPGSSHFVPPTPEALTRHFPQLEILELIGAGGMGAVYKARQPGLDRFVAVKILPPEVGADPAFAQRFAREAQALAKLTHQKIVAVHDFGVAGGLYYFIMEYVDGANLRQFIRTGEMKPAEALAIVPQICEALQFAHDEGVVHRDIKPENILLDNRGRVKIADFGLARLLGKATPELNLTATNQVMGTLHYMAPEQLQGLRTVDHRADIYSLGVVFYEMLTGELPLGRFAPPSQKVEVDVRLDEIVLRSLENKPERRYQQANELKADVERFSLYGSVAVAAPPQAATRTRNHVQVFGMKQDEWRQWLRHWTNRPLRQYLAITLCVVQFVAILIVAVLTFETESIIVAWPAMALFGYAFALAAWPLRSRETFAFGLSAPLVTSVGALFLAFVHETRSPTIDVFWFMPTLIFGYLAFYAARRVRPVLLEALRWQIPAANEQRIEWQFSLKSLLIAMTVLAVLISTVVGIARVTDSNTISIYLAIYAATNFALCGIGVERFLHLRQRNAASGATQQAERK